MAREVEVVLEGFGERSLRKVFDAEEVRGKAISEVVATMLSQDWQGSDRGTYNSIARKVQTASGSYVPEVARGGVMLGEPVTFLPVRTRDRVDPYIQDNMPQPQLRIAITPAHKVG